MNKRTLVIGGTGPTGPFIVDGLTDRGYEVTVFHSGKHEVEFKSPDVRHIHDDPHFEEGLKRGIGDQDFDLVVAQYGRLKLIAEFFAGRTDRLVAIGGATAIYGAETDERWGPLGRPALFPEQTPILAANDGSGGMTKIAYRMVEAMQAVFDVHDRGGYAASYLAYPLNYGPRNPGQYDWSIVRRLLEGRRRIVIADGGLKVESRVFSQNAAQAVLLAIDNPDIAAGKRYNVADKYSYTMRQRIEYIAKVLGCDIELIDMPYELAWPAHPYWRHTPGHRLTDSSVIRHELGYTESVEPAAGFAESIEWLVNNRPESRGGFEEQLGDRFDYDAEDALIDSWLGATVDLVANKPVRGEHRHQYAHPKAPADAAVAGKAT
jgi:nucleoside-diphosphate-sugar epimerase